MEWQSIWDSEAKAFYYWNPVSKVTTWDKPVEAETAVKEEVAEEISEADKAKMAEYYNSKEYYDWYMENMTLQAQQQATEALTFHKKKDQFADLIANPSYDSSMQSEKHTRAFTQMNHYFDVEQYQLQRQTDKAGISKKLSKKDIQKFRQKKLLLKREALMSSQDK